MCVCLWAFFFFGPELCFLYPLKDYPVQPQSRGSGLFRVYKDQGGIMGAQGGTGLESLRGLGVLGVRLQIGDRKFQVQMMILSQDWSQINCKHK